MATQLAKVMFEHNTTGNYLYIIYKNKKYVSDKEIIKLLSLTKKQYRDLMLNTFNGFLYNDEIYYRNDDDIIRAAEWLLENVNDYITMTELLKSIN